MTRRFVALPVPADVRASVEHAVAPIRPRRSELAWTEAAGWHVTLAFVGELADDALPALRDATVRAVAAMAPVTGGGLQLRTAEPGRFAGRALWVGIADDPGGGVARLGDRIQQELADARLPVARQAVRAHLTLARARRASVIDDALVTEVSDALASRSSPPLWTARTVGIWGAYDREGPARYVVDTEVSLAGS